jgi:hypothetical protein
MAYGKWCFSKSSFSKRLTVNGVAVNCVEIVGFVINDISCLFDLIVTSAATKRAPFFG